MEIKLEISFFDNGHRFCSQDHGLNSLIIRIMYTGHLSQHAGMVGVQTSGLANLLPLHSTRIVPSLQETKFILLQYQAISSVYPLYSKTKPYHYNLSQTDFEKQSIPLLR